MLTRGFFYAYNRIMKNTPMKTPVTLTGPGGEEFSSTLYLPFQEGDQFIYTPGAILDATRGWSFTVQEAVDAHV